MSTTTSTVVSATMWCRDGVDRNRVGELVALEASRAEPVRNACGAATTWPARRPIGPAPVIRTRSPPVRRSCGQPRSNRHRFGHRRLIEPSTSGVAKKATRHHHPRRPRRHRRHVHGLATGQESRQRYRTNLRIEQSACAGHMYFQAAGIRVSASTTSSATRAGSSHCVKKLGPGMVTNLIWGRQRFAF